MKEREVVIIDGCRTINARAHKTKGWFRNVRPDHLLREVYKAIFARNPKVKPEDVDEVWNGTSALTGMTSWADRNAWFTAGYPETVPIASVSAVCPSGMFAAEVCIKNIIVGDSDISLATGLEDMLHVPMGMGRDNDPDLDKRYSPRELAMGITAEKVAKLYNIDRKDMELMAYHSHKRAAAARDAGKFKHEIIPIEGEKEDGTRFMCVDDQWIRDDISLEQMAAMKPAFDPENGVVTAATSSPLTTGACAMLLMSREKADKLGLDYHLKYKASARVSVDPTIMGVGPIYSVKKLLAKTGMTLDDIDVVELNEAFASQSLACVRELGLEKEIPFKKTNLWGGAIALGHPLGESGLRIMITLNNIMKYEKPDAKYGLATLCGGLGPSGAMLWERT